MIKTSSESPSTWVRMHAAILVRLNQALIPIALVFTGTPAILLGMALGKRDWIIGGAGLCLAAIGCGGFMLLLTANSLLFGASQLVDQIRSLHDEEVRKLVLAHRRETPDLNSLSRN
jgi:hypothetical protein